MLLFIKAILFHLYFIKQTIFNRYTFLFNLIIKSIYRSFSYFAFPNQSKSIECYQLLFEKQNIPRSMIKSTRIDHKDLIKSYMKNYNPLLLPKMGFIGYHIKSDPSFQVFLTKLQLFDKSTIERQNVFIHLMKELFSRLENTTQVEAQEILSFIPKGKKEIKSCINFQQDKYKYRKILKSRLEDLKQLIFHIQRQSKEPIKQKQCKNILQNEIQKIIFKEIQPIKREESKQKLYFKINQYKQSEKNKNNDAISKIQRKEKTQRISKKYNTQAFENDDLQYQNEAEHEELKIKYFNQPQLTQAEDYNFHHVQRSNKDQKITIKRGTLRSQNSLKRNNNSGIKIKKTHQRQSFLPISENKQGDYIQVKRKQTKLSTLGLKTNQENHRTNSKRATSIINIKSSRSIMRSQKENRERISQQATKSRHYLQKNKKKSMKMIDTQGNQIKSQDDSEGEEDQQQLQNRTPNHQKTVKFNEILEQKKNFVRPKRMARNFGRKDTRIGFNSIQLDEQEKILQNNQQSESNQAQFGKKQSNPKIMRRDALIGDSTIDPNLQKSNVNRSVAALKRKGKVIGLQPSKMLHRLLMEENIQQMLLQNEIKGIFNKGRIKYSDKRLATQSSKQSQKKRGKNNILMEIDLQNPLEEEKDGYKYVNSENFKVTSRDLFTIRQKYVKVLPYQHKKIAEFYGGDILENLNNELISNQSGQYYFNRLFVHGQKASETEDYQPYNFQEINKKIQDARFDFASQLCRNLNIMGQKQFQPFNFQTQFI